ncbi:unnamed protein product [Gadus morhua 'NCC']
MLPGLQHHRALGPSSIWGPSSFQAAAQPHQRAGALLGSGRPTAVTVMPFSTVRAVQGCWFYGDTFCLLHSAFDMFLTSVSSFHLICIAVDRHEAVVHAPALLRNITMTVAWLMVSASWAWPPSTPTA